MKLKSSLPLAVLISCSHLQAQEFRTPESAAYDSATKRYFISNYGDGNIIQIDSVGAKSYFKQGLSKSLGMVIDQNRLYVIANLQMIRGFDLADGSPTLEVKINEALFLNDVTCDHSGSLYVTDSNANAVFKINIAAQTYSLLVRTKLDNPNGIIYDKLNNRLVVCYFREKAPIDEISLKDSTLTTLVVTGFDNLDGLTLDEFGNFYVSSWGPGSFATGFTKSGTIYKYDHQFKNKPIVVSTGHHGPADIFFNIEKDVLVIPQFLDNEVKFQSLK